MYMDINDLSNSIDTTEGSLLETKEILQKSDNSMSSHFSQIINEKNDIIKSAIQSQNNYLTIFNELTSIISNINKTFEKHNDNKSNIESISSVKVSDLEKLEKENTALNNTIDVFENRNLKLHRQISVQKNTYKSLNRVYVQTLSDMLDMKINYVDEMLELKKTHHNMIFNLSQRIDDLQYKLKDKENEVNMICRVCFTKPIDILINDCNHLIMCSECLEELTNVPNADLLCPLCQTGISGFKKVYLPE